MTAPGVPRTAAGRALLEWAANAMPAQQQDIWREHVLLIEAEATDRPLANNEHGFIRLIRHEAAASGLDMLERMKAGVYESIEAHGCSPCGTHEYALAIVAAEYARLAQEEGA